MKRTHAATVFGCASVLLAYPEEDLPSDLARVRTGLDRLGRNAVRAHLEGVVDWLGGKGPIEAAAAYVDTFDLRRGTSLHLTYYRHGDTRERGMALAALADAYRAAGFVVGAGELPDYLPALLELAAVDPAGASVLADQRPALDALGRSLAGLGSPWAAAVSAVGEALPGPTRADREALRRYRAQGPPSEQVGLEPFAPPEVVSSGVTMGATRR